MNVTLNFKYQYFSFYNLLSCFINLINKIHQEKTTDVFNGVYVQNHKRL